MGYPCWLPKALVHQTSRKDTHKRGKSLVVSPQHPFIHSFIHSLDHHVDVVPKQRTPPPKNNNHHHNSASQQPFFFHDDNDDDKDDYNDDAFHTGLRHGNYRCGCFGRLDAVLSSQWTNFGTHGRICRQSAQTQSTQVWTSHPCRMGTTPTAALIKARRIRK